MKKFVAVLLAALMAAAFFSCAAPGQAAGEPSAEGIKPYSLTDSEKELLQSFGVNGDNAQILEFGAPRKAVSCAVTVYCLGKNNKWEKVGGGAVTDENKNSGSGNGRLTVKINEDRSMDLALLTNGTVSYKINPPSPHTDFLCSVISFLEEFQEIKVNCEIPVLLVTYSNAAVLQSHPLQDYFTPSTFDGGDTVQAVTLTFSDRQNTD